MFKLRVKLLKKPESFREPFEYPPVRMDYNSVEEVYYAKEHENGTLGEVIHWAMVGKSNVGYFHLDAYNTPHTEVQLYSTFPSLWKHLPQHIKDNLKESFLREGEERVFELERRWLYGPDFHVAPRLI